MGRAAASQAGIDAGALEEVEFHWGSAYHLAVVDGVCTARRRDGKGGTLTDPVPEGLHLQIVADYRADPVPRDPAPASTLAGGTPGDLNAEIRADSASASSPNRRVSRTDTHVAIAQATAG